MASQIRMQDVADAAGVSRMAVSLALRNSPRVSEAKRQCIQALAASMGYRPHPLIQRLVTHLGDARRKASGEVIAWINAWKEPKAWRNPVFLSMYKNAAGSAEKHGFRLEEFWLREPGMTGRKLSRILYQRGIECLIVGPIPKGGGHLQMEWDRFSTIALGYSMLAPQLNRVTNHQLHSARLAIRQMVRRGYRRIGFCITKDENRRVDHSWLAALAYHQFQIPAKNRIRPLLWDRWSDKSFLAWVEKERPDGVIALHSWVKDVAVRGGYRVPQDLAVVALDLTEDDHEVAGINQQYAVIGTTAVETVMGQTYSGEKGLPLNPKTIMIEGRWIDGRSLGKRIH